MYICLPSYQPLCLYKNITIQSTPINYATIEASLITQQVMSPGLRTSNWKILPTKLPRQVIASSIDRTGTVCFELQQRKHVSHVQEENELCGIITQISQTTTTPLRTFVKPILGYTSVLQMGDSHHTATDDRQTNDTLQPCCTTNNTWSHRRRHITSPETHAITCLL